MITSMSFICNLHTNTFLVFIDATMITSQNDCVFKIDFDNCCRKVEHSEGTNEKLKELEEVEEFMNL